MTTVSVIIPCYNASPWLRETLESAINQTHPPLEILLIDDGSTDDSAAIAESFGPPVRVIRQENQGESVARNRGIDEAKGEWLAFLDADDVWKPEKLERQVELTQREDVVLIHTSWFPFGTTADVISASPVKWERSVDVASLLIKAFVNTSTALVRGGLAVRFPEWTQRGEDMIYFAELSLSGAIVFVDRALVGYRFHDRQQTRNANRSQVDHHESRLSWLEQNRHRVPSGAYENVRCELFNKLWRLAKFHRKNKNWQEYWEIRRFLSQHADCDVPLRRQTRFPRVADAIRDLVKKLRRTRRDNPASP